MARCCASRLRPPGIPRKPQWADLVLYFKGKADFIEDDILAVELWANSLPWRILGYKTPDEAFEEAMDKIYVA